MPKRALLALGFVGLVLLIYYGLGAFVAYTDDAYVRSDFVEVAPEVAGPVRTVHVRDDQPVKAGDPLAEIDPRPFELVVALKQAQVVEAQAVTAAKKAESAALTANLQAADAAQALAQVNYDRFAVLARDQTVSQADLDRADETLKSAQGGVAAAKGRIAVNLREAATAQTQVAVAEAGLAVARYDLSRTALAAPVPGFVTNLGLRPGDFARVGTPLIGLVDDTRWRVIANFTESVASSLTEGMPVWVWLDATPGRLYRGRVRSIGRGIARQPGAEQLLPYVKPTTDWIRLSRRLPVTIDLDERPARLFMGADARVVLMR
ncbi:HlyD family secretion protein [uncultured Methylobacterium sp.]|uniref:HlyD family secretion protein n=1 Tax=uncultured Methylobacterium sp. TaxID=157278 RepID=UPI002603574A|nr:HlyD family secretion protein [uncultured Methylobacterium sp.]